MEEKTVVAFFATVQTEGEKSVERQIEYYNLDAIISVGYRVNSKRGIAFRKWATNLLKEYLIKGYNINQDKITQKKLNQLHQTEELFTKTLINQNLVNSTG
ncbi:MAG: RhuM family protein [Rickettsia endosymbiont of Argas persicus]